MKPDIVVLADVGHVRDGLLYVVGGGIDRMFAPSLPAMLQATIVARFTLDADDFGREHTLSLTVRQAEDDIAIARMQGAFQANPGRPTSSESHIATSIKLDGLALPQYGKYTLVLDVDDVPMKTFELAVDEAAEARKRRSTDVRPKPPNPTVRPKTARRKG